MALFIARSSGTWLPDDTISKNAAHFRSQTI